MQKIVHDSSLLKHLWLISLVVLSLLYSAPNLYGEDPAIQISTSNQMPFREPSTLTHTVNKVLKEHLLTALSLKIEKDTLLLRFQDPTTQLTARDYLKAALGDAYTVALNLAPKTPRWLQAIGADPLKLGLDLRGGVHFLLDVDVDTVLAAREQGDIHSIRTLLQDKNLRYTDIKRKTDHHSIRIHFHNAEHLSRALPLLTHQFPDYSFTQPQNDDNTLVGRLPQNIRDKTTAYVIEQTITALRNRVNELGVSEAVVQRQGAQHISVDLPGIQDTARAKNMIGKTATLRFQLADMEHDVTSALASTPPAGTKIYYDSNGRPLLLKNAVLLEGSAITYATAVTREGHPAVNIRLGGGGESLFHRATADNIGKPLAVVYVETKMELKNIKGKMVSVRRQKERVISVATIQSALGNNFDITGLGTAKYAANLALLLRSGALAAPVGIIQETTVGPSLGQSNIHKGILSMEIGALLVFVFMAVYYRLFGMIANLALLLNIVFILSLLSLLGATLTLPGIAGIVLTVGMAVDANVLINERIREEIRRGMTPLASIKAGYERAFPTIVDSNITTLIVAVILFSLGSGSVKGFAVTLIIGLLSSMITAIFFTRAIIEAIYQRPTRGPTKALSIGITPT